MRVAFLLGLLALTACRAAPAPRAEPAETACEVIPLRHAVAAELVDVLEKLSLAGVQAARTRSCEPCQPGRVAGPSRPACRFVADPRTNSLVVQAAPEALPRIRELVARLDVDAREGGGAPAH
jgi:type II secretory pathway component GspD/PulD (secretin)